jgi:hypothetical protein
MKWQIDAAYLLGVGAGKREYTYVLSSYLVYII